jgi:hypothetical protein
MPEGHTSDGERSTTVDRERPGTLALSEVAPEAMDADELRAEVRRLRLRMEALREQRDERIDQLRQIKQQVAGEDVTLPGDGPQPVNAWRQRAERAEAEMAALLATRSLRLLRVPRDAYGRLLAVRDRGRSRG